MCRCSSTKVVAENRASAVGGTKVVLSDCRMPRMHRTMSHRDYAPNTTFARGDARLAVIDLFAFPNPSDRSKSILIMDVHPSSGVNPPELTTAEPFSPDALYEIRIDTDGDAIADVAYQARFTRGESGGQMATLRRLVGAEAAETGEAGTLIIEAAPVSMGLNAQPTRAGEYRFFAGWRSNPLFVDVGLLNDLQFVGADLFAKGDICSIVLEMPNAALGAPEVRLWARTVARSNDGRWVQIERCARVLQARFLGGDQSEAYGAAEPKDDAQFVDVFAKTLQRTGGFSPEEARRVAGTLLPDLLPYDPQRPVFYPVNGRRLSDDAVDSFLTVVTNAEVTQDGIGPHGDLLVEFPYVGVPHHDRENLVEVPRI